MLSTEWHSLTAEEALSRLDSAESGLSSDEAFRRLEEHGPNELIRLYRPSPLRIFLHQFENYLIIVLIAASVLSWISGETTNAYVILGIILFISLLGFFQEYKAERAMEALREMVAPEAAVIRSGRVSRIPVEELVPGDIIYLEAGDKVPADARLLEETSLEVVEASLTGESLPLRKDTSPVAGETPLAERCNMLFMGTIIVYGNCRALVVSTGQETELGKIAGLIQERPEDPPLKAKFQQLSRHLALVVLSACIIIFGIEVGRGSPVLDTLIIAAALAVAGIPESLPFVVTITLAYGTQIMARRNAIIRRLPAVETLGSTTVICTDKTGTLTKGEMTVRQIWTSRTIGVTGSGYDPKGSYTHDEVVFDPSEDDHLLSLLMIGVLCNNSELAVDDGWRIIGDPTEGALLVAACKAGLKGKDRYGRVLEYPFDSEQRRMTTLHRSPEGEMVAMKGAPEAVLRFCSYIRDEYGVRSISEADRIGMLQIADKMADSGLRILALASKEREPAAPVDRETLENDLVFAGLVGIMDPPRPEVKEAIRITKLAGIRPVMITGDHRLTASAIGEELGIKDAGDVLEGTDLDRMSDDELFEVIEDITVFARATAKHKVRIVEALKRRGHIVAMTGDGVNDAPALRKADIGVAMGITGTEVSKEASDMIITDDNFSTIVSAVGEGRRIYDNIRKASSYLLSCNFAEVMTMFVGVMLGLPVPLLALQILWINIVTDEFPAIGLSVEPGHIGLMMRKPRNPEEPILTRGLFIYTLTLSTVIFIGSLGLYALALHSGESLSYARTTVFASLVIFELYNAYNSRSLHESFFEMNPMNNKKLIAGLFASLVALLAAVYLPAMQALFETTPLDLESWATILVVSSTVVLAAEFFKRRFPLV
jgi:Ca2+-transporting ATPase